MTTETTIVHIPLSQLRESPFNPRRTFVGIEELAASIKAEGRVHQPLLVRPILPNPLRDDITDGFEVVFGHRRLRAAAEAGLASVPCMVRAMSDAEARSAQIAENLQRADVHPIEEAEGMQAMMADGLSADELAETVGKSRSYVYSRLKLLQACPQVRDACLAGKIGSEVALYIARLRTEALQLDALKHIQAASIDAGDGGKDSVRRIRVLLTDRYTLDLSRTIFDTADALLTPSAGPCTTCPKRSGNAPEYADLVQDYPRRWAGDTALNPRTDTDNICTDPDCFAAKRAAHLQLVAARLEQAGHTVVTGKKVQAALDYNHQLKRDAAWVPVKIVKAQLKRGQAMPTPVMVLDPSTGAVLEAVPRAALVAAGLAEAPKPKSKASTSSATPAVDQQAQRAAAEAQAKRIIEHRKTLLQQVRAEAAKRPRTADELRLVVRYLVNSIDDYEACKLLTQAWGDHVKMSSLSPDQVALMLLDVVCVPDAALAPWELDDDDEAEPYALAELAQLYGLPHELPPEPMPEVQTPVVSQLMAITAGTPTPGTAARAAKVGAAGKPAEPAGKGPAMKYRCASTGSTWSGRGLQPAWVKAHLAAGGTLADLETGPAAQKVKDDAGDAGEAERDPNTADMFEATGA